MTPNRKEEITELVKELDGENFATFGLMICALRRDDKILSAGLDNYGRAPRSDNNESCIVDFGLISRIKTICDEFETSLWGRALIDCVMRGDQQKADALQNLMRRRVAC